LGEKEASDLLKKADWLYSAKGKNLVRLDLREDKPSAEEIQKLMVGPTGNLRAPTFKRGRTVFVGFNEDAYNEIFKLN
jgi:arsenate reductase-like glutaredoxin family protein